MASSSAVTAVMLAAAQYLMDENEYNYINPNMEEYFQRSMNSKRTYKSIQRDPDRERAQARNASKGKIKDDGLTTEQRRERDAKALQEKAARKAAQSTGGGGGGERVDAGEKGTKR